MRDGVRPAGAHLHAYFFDDEAAANSLDAVLASVPATRRTTLLAERRPTPAGPVYHFDIHLQGTLKTVFF